MFGLSRGRVRRVRRGVVAGLVLVVVGAVGLTASAGAAPPQIRVGAKHGLVMARGYAHHNRSGHGRLKLLIDHNGPVLSSADVTPIFWGSSTDWNAFSSGPGNTASGLGTFYGGIGGTSYIDTNSEYTNSSPITVTANAFLSDTSDPTPSGLSNHAAPTTADVLTVVSNTLEAHNAVPSKSGNYYYPVYSDIPRGHRSYCAWHSDGDLPGTSIHVQFAFFFDVAGDPGCDPQSPITTMSEGLQALANMSGHELSEALTDPRGTAWFDQSGLENADKCVWTFNGTETFKHGSTWYVQGNFSNAAATSSPPSGYDGGGCVNGN